MDALEARTYGIIDQIIKGKNGGKKQVENRK